MGILRYIFNYCFYISKNFRLEIITTYFSDQVVAGFTTAATFHVFVSQIAEFFGLTELPRRSGPGYLFVVQSNFTINCQKIVENL